jgi:hypothetical protein
MIKGGEKMRPFTMAVLTLLLVCLTLPALADDALPKIPPAAADDTLPKIPSGESPSVIPEDPEVGKSYSVTCYLGNPSEGRNLGSLMVTSVTQAGPACNSAFYDCHDGCYGCITDGDNVCVDKYGSKYQR